MSENNNGHDTEAVKLEKIKNFEDRIDRATGAEKLALIQEAMDYIRSQGVAINVDELVRLVEFTTGMVDSFLNAIILTAKEMGAEAVPVEFIVELRQEAAQHVQKSVFGAVDTLGVPLDYGVPDDLSGFGF